MLSKTDRKVTHDCRYSGFIQIVLPHKKGSQLGLQNNSRAPKYMLTNLLNEDALLRDSFGVCNTFSSNSSVSGISSVFSYNDLKTVLLGLFSEILYGPLCKINPNKLRVKPCLSVITARSMLVKDVGDKMLPTLCRQNHDVTNITVTSVTVNLTNKPSLRE